MAPSDSFGAGIFDDEIEEVPRETPRHEERETQPSPPEPASHADHDEEEEEVPPSGDEPRPPSRRRDRGRGRGRDRDRDRGPEPVEERERTQEPAPEPVGERGSERAPERAPERDRERGPEPGGERDQGRGRDRMGDRRDRDRGRPPRGRRDGGEDDRQPGAYSEALPGGAMPAVASGVATGAGEAPAGTLVHQRVALLVDADSLDSEANERHGAKVSYRRVFTLALRGRIAVRALAYMSEESEGSRIPFQDHLGSSGFETVRRVGPGRGAWNVRLALDAIALAEKVDTVVIASSSGELLPLLHHLQTQGVRVEVASFAPLDANPLSAHAVTFTPLGRSALYVL